MKELPVYGLTLRRVLRPGRAGMGHHWNRTTIGKVDRVKHNYTLIRVCPGISTFISVWTAVLLFHCTLAGQQTVSGEKELYLESVNGRLAGSEIGLTLTHEHIMSNFGKEPEAVALYDIPKLLGQTIPYLKYLQSLGVRTIFDCTTAYFGRHVKLLKTISDSTGIQVVTNTGIYGAADDRYIPQFAYQMEAEAIAGIWIREYKTGIDGTGIKPGFVKLGFDKGVPSEIDLKLFKAGIITHQETGLTLAVHTGDNLPAAKAQLNLLKEYKMDPSDWIWVHADQFMDDEILMEFASQGAWISLDGISKDNYTAVTERILKFKRNNLLGKILLSHDGNGFPNGGEIRDFDAIMSHAIPALISGGCSEAEVQQLLTENPRNAYGLD